MLKAPSLTRRQQKDHQEGTSEKFSLGELWRQTKRCLLPLASQPLKSSSSPIHDRLCPLAPCQSLHELVQRLLKTKRLLINDHAFCSHGCKDSFVHSIHTSRNSHDDTAPYFGLRLTCPSSLKRVVIRLHATDVDAATDCLKFLMDLPDAHYQKIGIWKYDYRVQLEKQCLQSILNNARRHVTFSRMQFGPLQSSVLAQWGNKTSIGFYQCEFLDGGRAFVRALQERTDSQLQGPRTLHISGLPFDNTNWQLFLQNINGNLDSLQLFGVAFNTLNCHAISDVTIDHLHVDVSRMQDKGNVLMDAVRAGHGPRSLSLWNERFGKLADWLGLFDALKSPHCRLKRFEVSRLPANDNENIVIKALTKALQQNKSLEELCISNAPFGLESWNELLRSLTMHPTLRSLDLAMKQGVDRTLSRQRTRAAALLLSRNHRIEQVAFHRPTFDRVDWDAWVAPRLDSNRCRKQALSLQRPGDQPDTNNTAALLGAALTAKRESPTGLWLLLSLNQDELVCHVNSKFS